MKPFFTLLFLLVFAIVPTSRAQSATPEPFEDSTMRTLIAAQVVESLDSPYTMVRSQTLKNVIVFSTLYRDRINLEEAVAKIARVAKSDEQVQNRRLALAALRSIGSYRASKYLAQLEGIQEEEFRTLVAGVLSEYYQVHHGGAL